MRLESMFLTVTIFGVLAACSSPHTVSAKQKPTHDEIAGTPHLQASAEDLKATIVTPCLSQPHFKGTNVLWCNTFQLAWNELCEFTEGAIRMEAAPEIARWLNRKEVSKLDLDKASYVARAGRPNKDFYKSIRAELDTKFGNQAASRLPILPEQNVVVAYAYLFKALPFRWEFNRFHGALIFKGLPVESFGLTFDSNSSNDVLCASQVDILSYQNNDSFILELKTKEQEDRLILAKLSPETTLGKTIDHVAELISKGNHSRLIDDDVLEIPVLNFDILREYSELYNHPIITSNANLNKMNIACAFQSTRFRLDETGSVLKSEAYAVVAACFKEVRARKFIFNKPFLVLLQRRGAKHPYFAVWVDNSELLVPSPERSPT